MSRKSIRLQSKPRRGRQPPAILNRKRKFDSNQEEDELDGFKQMQVENNDSNGISSVSPEFTRTTWSRFRALSFLPSNPIERQSPLPELNWAESQDVWDIMVKKDFVYKRDQTVLSRHPALQAKMRSILLDWLIEVCDVYRLHRDTYYLALDFVDRFLATQTNIPKQQLQLIGITALFLAAKIEEIFAPKLEEFAFVTDGACTQDEIIGKELVILKALNWDLSPMTVFGWLKIFLQLINFNDATNTASFVIPQYSANVLLQVSQLMDLCMLDIGCLQFSYSTIAASALYHVTSKELVQHVSGFSWSDIVACVQWMTPFAVTTRENGPLQPKFFQQIAEEDMPNIQTHDIDLQLLEKAQKRKHMMKVDLSNSPPLSTGLLTPPCSEEKPPKVGPV